ncbi:MAG: YdhR family protein [Rhizobiaceae bacterium]
MNKGKSMYSGTQSLLKRREVMGFAAASASAILATGLGIYPSNANTNLNTGEKPMSPKAFVYTELQLSVPFTDAPWKPISDAIQQQPGFVSKTWLSGVGNNSVGGIYSFDSIEHAQEFVTGYFPDEAKKFGVAHNTRIFDAMLVREASEGLNSAHFGGKQGQKPGAFVYTEVQVNVPFENAPWKERNPVLKQQKGLISKTWLSGLHTNTLGGLDAFDTIENATAFAIDSFPQTAAKMNAAFYTRIFDADITEEASRFLNSPFYS